MSKPAHVLLVKTSSLGDVLHTFPALTDAAEALPGTRFDWLVEEGYAELPRWHVAVERAIPVAVRRWRRTPWRAWRDGEWRKLRAELAGARYDLVIDAQGLVKSALLARLVSAPCSGYDATSVRERLATLAYRDTFRVPRTLHAIERTRRLFAAALAYPVPTGAPTYRISPPHSDAAPGALLFLHGTSRAAKCWPEAHWRALTLLAGEAGLRVLLPWGDEAERVRALRIAADADHVRVLPRLTLGELAACIAGARAVVAVDTGLGHLAAALGVPCVSLYGPTEVALVGTVGPRQRHLAAADGALASLAPRAVWQALAPWLPA